MHVLALSESSWARHTIHREVYLGSICTGALALKLIMPCPDLLGPSWMSGIFHGRFACVLQVCTRSLPLIWHTGVWVLKTGAHRRYEARGCFPCAVLALSEL